MAESSNILEEIISTIVGDETGNPDLFKDDPFFKGESYLTFEEQKEVIKDCNIFVDESKWLNIDESAQKFIFLSEITQLEMKSLTKEEISEFEELLRRVYVAFKEENFKEYEFGYVGGEYDLYHLKYSNKRILFDFLNEGFPILIIEELIVEK